MTRLRRKIRVCGGVDAELAGAWPAPVDALLGAYRSGVHTTRTPPRTNTFAASRAPRLRCQARKSTAGTVNLFCVQTVTKPIPLLTLAIPGAAAVRCNALADP
jgi:hypothetical protein